MQTFTQERRRKKKIVDSPAARIMHIPTVARQLRYDKVFDDCANQKGILINTGGIISTWCLHAGYQTAGLSQCGISGPPVSHGEH